MKSHAWGRRAAWSLAVGAVIALLPVATALAASISVSATPQVVSDGQTVNVTISGTADQPGFAEAYLTVAKAGCAPTGNGEHYSTFPPRPVVVTTNPAGNADNPLMGPFSTTDSFTAAQGVSYRLCAYLNGFNDTDPPVATDNTVVCATGSHVSGNDCVSNTPPPARCKRGFKRHGNRCVRIRKKH